MIASRNGQQHGFRMHVAHRERGERCSGGWIMVYLMSHVAGVRQRINKGAPSESIKQGSDNMNQRRTTFTFTRQRVTEPAGIRPTSFRTCIHATYYTRATDGSLRSAAPVADWLDGVPRRLLPMAHPPTTA